MRRLFDKVIRNNFFQGGVILTVSNFIVGFMNYLFNVLIGRSLGPTGYGEIAALFSYLSILGIPIIILTSVIILKIGSRKEHNLAYAYALEGWIWIRIRKWWPILLAPILITPFISDMTNLSPLTSYFLIPYFILAVLSGFYDGAIQGLHLFMVSSLILVTLTSVKVLSGVITFFWFPHIGVILVLLFLSAVAKIIISRRVFKQVVTTAQIKEVSINKSLKDLYKQEHIWFTVASILSLTLIGNIDVIFVKRFFSAHEAGIFSAWSLFAKIILYIIGPIINISFIFFSSKKHSQYHQSSLVISLISLLIGGLGLSIIYYYFAPQLVSLMFGDKYTDLIPYIKLASVFGILYVGINHLNNYFLAKKSYLVFLLPIAIPFYVVSLMLFGKGIEELIYINILFGAIVTSLYFILYWIYNLKIRTSPQNVQ